jgi:hypothetical protein
MIRDWIREGLTNAAVIGLCLFVAMIGADAVWRGWSGLTGASPQSQTTVATSQAATHPLPRILGKTGMTGDALFRAAQEPAAMPQPHVLTWSEELDLGAEKEPDDMAAYTEMVGTDLGNWLREKTVRLLQDLLGMVFPSDTVSHP